MPGTNTLTVQGAFFLYHRRWADAWWRVGASGVAMMGLLGTSVWEGHPGAATRVLLPMSVAFAVLAVRSRAGWGWIMAGSLTVFSGTLALWDVPHDSRELAAGRFARGSYVAKIESGWFGAERNGRAVWSWAATQGTLSLETAPRRAQTSGAHAAANHRACRHRAPLAGHNRRKAAVDSAHRARARERSVFTRGELDHTGHAGKQSRRRTRARLCALRCRLGLVVSCR